MKPDEETRAREYRRMMSARQRSAEQQKFAAHRGDAAAAAAVRADWWPIADPVRGWDAGSEPEDGEGLQLA